MPESWVGSVKCQWQKLADWTLRSKRVGVSLSHGEVRSRRVNATGVTRRRLSVYLSWRSVGRSTSTRTAQFPAAEPSRSGRATTPVHSPTQFPFTPARTLPPPNSCSGSHGRIICFFSQSQVRLANTMVDAKQDQRLWRLALHCHWRPPVSPVDFSFYHEAGSADT